MRCSLTKDAFLRIAERARRDVDGDRRVFIPIAVRLLSDQLTPVLAYRRLVVADERQAPSFLLESVEGGERQGRHSILGAHPVIEVTMRERHVRAVDRLDDPPTSWQDDRDQPFDTLKAWSRRFSLAMPTDEDQPTFALPDCLIGGWVGYAAYDTVRYAEPGKLPFEDAPADDRELNDVHFGFYDEVVVFDHVDRLVLVVRLVDVSTNDDPGDRYDHAVSALESTAARLQEHSKPLTSGFFEMPTGVSVPESNLTREQHAEMVANAQEYIRAGDIFQVVVGQRFERTSPIDPFDVYRALRTVNPSPYMVYLQAEGCILIASSPEILCRVRNEERDGRPARILTNRPLAGTRKRGVTDEEDRALEADLLADDKERAEHVMLVDLGRNDVGKVCRPGSIELPALMEIERYSHVMHISSTVTGELREDLDCWDALAATLPVGTISGAPKVRAMQIIDELEPVRRGPYGGGVGYVSLTGEMDIALALRTIVTPIPDAVRDNPAAEGVQWTYHLQAAGGIVYDSVAEAEYMETVNKAAAMLRAIEVAERAFNADH